MTFKKMPKLSIEAKNGDKYFHVESEYHLFELIKGYYTELVFLQYEN